MLLLLYSFSVSQGHPNSLSCLGKTPDPREFPSPWMIPAYERQLRARKQAPKSNLTNFKTCQLYEAARECSARHHRLGPLSYSWELV